MKRSETYPAAVLGEINGHIVEIVSRYVDLKRAGSSFKALCPFHEEHTPSLSVHPGRGVFHCFGCGESGDAFDFVQKIEHVSFPEAVQIAAALTGTPLSGLTAAQRAEYERKQRIRDGARIWRETELLKRAEALRERDLLIGFAHQVYHSADFGDLREQAALDLLDEAYNGKEGEERYDVMQWNFERLLRDHDFSTAELHRELV